MIEAQNSTKSEQLKKPGHAKCSAFEMPEHDAAVLGGIKELMRHSWPKILHTGRGVTVCTVRPPRFGTHVFRGLIVKISPSA